MNDWSDWIGRSTTASALLDPATANHLSVTLDREPSFAAGDALPPAWHWLYFHDAVRASDLGPDGHPRLGLTMPPIGLARRMWAGGELTFHAPLWLGTTVSRRSTIHSIVPRRGQTGDLVFVNVGHEVRLADELCLEEQQTIVYRLGRTGAASPAPAAASTPAPAPADGTATVEWRLDSTAIFRYSALTFNGHRIHYDADYCREVEGYPDIVVQGPLIATLLLDLAVRESRTLGRFMYRAVYPLFLPRAFTVNASVDGDVTSLWAADHDGGLAMNAELVGTAPTTP